MNYEVNFVYGKTDLVEAISVSKKAGMAVVFVSEFDINNKRKKRRGYCLDLKALEALENYCKLQRKLLSGELSGEKK